MNKWSISLCALCVLSSITLGVVWSDPVLLTELNDPANGAAFYPHLSRDRSTLFFARDDSSNLKRLYTATRNPVTGTFSDITEISELSEDKNNYTPWVSDDGLRLYFGRYLGGSTGLRLNQASRSSVSDPWGDPLLFTDIHIDGKLDGYPTLTSDELTMYYVSDRANAADDTRIWMATRSSITEQFSNLTLVSELDFGNKILGPCVLPDGLTIYYAEKTNNQYDLYRATRNTTADPFSNIEGLSVNTPLRIESSPYITPDETELFFTGSDGIYYSYAIPEPATLALLAVGAGFLRRKNSF